MSNKEDIISILNAIDEINLKPKKKTAHKKTTQRTIPSLDKDLIIPSDVDKLIREAEKYKKLSFTFRETTAPTQSKKHKPERNDALILTEEFIDNPKSKKLKILDHVNEIKKLEENEKKLRLEIKNLKAGNKLQANIGTEILDQEAFKNFSNNTRENLKSIYKQVEMQKQLFVELKNHSSKIERDSNVYKENYERLIIENNELKTRLKIAKEQIINYETNKSDLLSALDQLNEILSKSNIVGKISPLKPSSDILATKDKAKLEPID